MEFKIKYYIGVPFAVMFSEMTRNLNYKEPEFDRKITTELILVNSDISASNTTGNYHLPSNILGYLPWGNDDSIISYENFVLCGRLLTGILIPIVCMIGIPANIINCLVFYTQGLRTRIIFLLFSLALTDLMFDLYVFVLFVERFYSQFMGVYVTCGPFDVFITNSGLSALYGFVYASGFLTMLIASERCVCVVTPFNVGLLLKTNTVYVIVCVTTVVVVTLHYIPSERYKVDCVYDPEIHAIVYKYFPSEFYLKNKALVNFLGGIVYGLTLPILFTIVTIATTAITATHLKSAARWRKRSTNRPTRSDVAVTKMLIATSCLFIACRVPDIIYRTTPLFVSDFRVGGRLQNISIISLCIVLLASAINCSFNILFYIKMGSLYRMTLKTMCSTKRGKHTSESKKQ